MTNDGVHSYTYDAENRIQSVDSGATTYVYNAAGMRVRKTTGGVSVDYLYDLAGNAVTELNTSGAWTRKEVYAGSRHVATYKDGIAGQTYFSHPDWLGTERARTDKNGAVTETCTNLPFGNAQACTGPSVSPLHFTGKQRDTETDNDYFGARYYISRQGRWLTPDWSARAEAVPYASLANPQTLNLYAYVGNNPVSATDPDGHCSICSRRGNGGEFIAGFMPFQFDITTAFVTNPGSLFDAAVQQAQARARQSEAIAHLKSLAKEFGIPEELVLATAAVESSTNRNQKPVDNIKTDKAGKPVLDENGNKIVLSTDYGLMQVNSGMIGQTVESTSGNTTLTTTIGSDVKTDWKANARAGVAILASEYGAAQRQLPSGSAQELAQRSYSGYNAGRKNNGRYLTLGRNDEPANLHDRNFLNRYKEVTGGKP